MEAAQELFPHGTFMACFSHLQSQQCEETETKIDNGTNGFGLKDNFIVFLKTTNIASKHEERGFSLYQFLCFYY